MVVVFVGFVWVGVLWLVGKEWLDVGVFGGYVGCCGYVSGGDVIVGLVVVGFVYG